MIERQVVNVFDSRVHDSFPRYVAKIFSEMWTYRFALKNFVVNNLRTRYRRSALGFLWSLLNPLFFMIILAVVFSTIFKQDIRTYSIYIFSGMIPWLYINASITMGCQTLINAEGFLKKVYIPKLLFPVVSVTTETVNFVLSIVSLYLLGLFVGFPVKITILYLPLVIFIAFLFNLGWVLIFSVTTIFFRDTTHLITIIFQALFYLAPIIYPLESIPEQYRSLFLFNPFYYYIILFRKVIYGEPALTWIDWLAPIGLMLLVLTVGLYILKRLDRTIVYRL